MIKRGLISIAIIASFAMLLSIRDRYAFFIEVGLLLSMLILSIREINLNYRNNKISKFANIASTVVISVLSVLIFIVLYNRYF